MVAAERVSYSSRTRGSYALGDLLFVVDQFVDLIVFRVHHSPPFRGGFFAFRAFALAAAAFFARAVRSAGVMEAAAAGPPILPPILPPPLASHFAEIL